MFESVFLFDRFRNVIRHHPPRLKGEMRNDRRFHELGKIVFRANETSAVFPFTPLFLEERTASGNAAQCNLIHANAKIARTCLPACH